MGWEMITSPQLLGLSPIGWQDVAAWVIIAGAVIHLLRTLVLPAFSQRSETGAGCASGCGTCPSNAAAQASREPAVFGLTMKKPPVD